MVGALLGQTLEQADYMLAMVRATRTRSRPRHSLTVYAAQGTGFASRRALHLHALLVPRHKLWQCPRST